MIIIIIAIIYIDQDGLKSDKDIINDKKINKTSIKK